MSFPTYLVAAGFLSAISLVWAQLWVQLSGQSNSAIRIQEEALLLGLAWAYASIFLALLGSLLAALDNIRNQIRMVGTWALGLLAYAALMVLANVSQSILSSFTRLLWDKSLAELIPFGIGGLLVALLVILIVIGAFSRDFVDEFKKSREGNADTNRL